jgi:peroxin-2
MDHGVCSLPIRQSKADNIASRRKLLLFLLLHPPIFPSYILSRLREYGLSNQWPDLPSDNWRRKAWRVVVWMENLARIWELGGWGMLLWDGRCVSAGFRTEEGADGRYPSLLMRALGLRLVPSSPHLAKLVSYEYMNRQLVWNAFTVSPPSHT